MTDTPAAGTILIYDAECFFCANYVRLLNLKAALGDVTLIDARDAQAVAPFGIAPAILNEGMMLRLGGEWFYGADAVHRIALLSTGSGFFNHVNATIFRNRPLASLLYPLLKIGRKIYLFLAGKSQIR